MNSDLLRQIKAKLKSEYYLMNDEWLKDCIEFYTDQHENPTNNEILQFVKIQWQLSDLREISNENGGLPNNISQNKLITLTGKYILQVEQMYDISTSKYKQLEQIRNTTASEVDPDSDKPDKWKPPKKRMMQLKLTDGVQDIIGIEYNKISKLNDMLLPGYKVMIIGPIKCRKGILLLEEGKLKGIGGEVDSLLIPNALENVLARALNLEENPDPYNDNAPKSNINTEDPKADESFFEDFEINLDEVSKIEGSINKNEQQPRVNVIATEVEPANVRNDNVSTNLTNVQSCENKTIFDDEDYFLEMVDEKQLLEPQVEQENIAVPYRALPTEENDDIIIISEEEDSIIKNVSMPSKSKESENTLRNEKKCSRTPGNLFVQTGPSTSSTSTSITSKNQAKRFVSEGKRPNPVSSPELKVVKKGKLDRSITEFMKPLPEPEPPKLCEFIYDVKREPVTKTTFKTIRGHVKSVGKLTKKDSMWILECTIGDGTGTIDVSFSNKILEELLGFSVKEFSIKKKLKQNPEVEQQLRMSFRSAEHKIKNLDALLELELNPYTKPVIVQVTDLNEKQKDIIDKRLKKFLSENTI